MVTQPATVEDNRINAYISLSRLAHAAGDKLGIASGFSDPRVGMIMTSWQRGTHQPATMALPLNISSRVRIKIGILRHKAHAQEQIERQVPAIVAPDLQVFGRRHRPKERLMGILAWKEP